MLVPSVDAATVPSDSLILDVRDDDEWAAGRIEGAMHIPIYEIIQRIDEIPTDRDIVCVCRVGNRSGQVTQFLHEQGYSIRNLDGGMMAWARTGRPMTASSGAVPTVL